MITYFIKAVVCSGLLLGVYFLFLEREKMHRFNRFYLLIAFALSWTIPLISFKIKTPVITEKIQPILTPTIFAEQQSSAETLMNTSVQQTPHNYLPVILWIIYAIVTFILLVRFAMNLYRVRELIIKNQINKHDGYSLVIVPDNTVSFSFFRYIFPAIDDYENGSMNQEIFLHESVHAEEMHSLDILFIELMKVFLWLNPFVFLYKKAIQLNHEFIADDVVVRYNNVGNYQHLLLSKIIQTPLSQLVSSSNYSITKKRFIMMTKKTNRRKSLWLKVSTIPVLGLLFIFFANKKAEAKNITGNSTTTTYQDTAKEGITQAAFDDYQTTVKRALVTRRNGMTDVSFTKIGGGNNMNKYAHLYQKMSPEQKRKAVFAIKLAPPPPPPPARKKFAAPKVVEDKAVKKFAPPKVVKDTAVFLPAKAMKDTNTLIEKANTFLPYKTVKDTITFVKNMDTSLSMGKNNGSNIFLPSKIINDKGRL